MSAWNVHLGVGQLTLSPLISPRQSVFAGQVGAGEQQRGEVDPRGTVHPGGSQVRVDPFVRYSLYLFCDTTPSTNRQGQMCCRCLRLVDPTKIGESPMENGSDLDDDDLSLYELLNSINHQPKSYRNEVTVQVRRRRRGRRRSSVINSRDLFSISCLCLIIIELLLFKS